jgi:hypothetical protein
MVGNGWWSSVFVARVALCASLALAVASCGGEGAAVVANAPAAPAQDPAPAPDPDPAPSPTNNPPVLDGSPALTAQAGTDYSFAPLASDADNDALTYTITGQPAWASFDATNGTLSGKPGDADVGQTGEIEITVSDGKAQDSIGPFRITIAERDAVPSPGNTPPAISGAPASSVMAGSMYIFVPTATDAENDTLTFSIANRPQWASFSTANGQLSGTPTAAQAGTTSNIRITVSDGKASTSLPAFSIQVRASLAITGSPSTSVQAGTAYAFQPSATAASGSTLTWSIQNKPGWASFSTTTGRLSGTPAVANVGSYANIRISVGDGKTTASLPAFSISVTSTPNRAPTITGTPPTSVVAGSAYLFKPTGADADGDTLSYSVANKPSWATFSIATGQLSGTPTSAGTYANVTISVNDGKATTALAPFTLTVTTPSSPPPPQGGTGNATVSWTPPTQNTDGSSLTNLAGYRIYYGTSTTNLTQSKTVSSPGLATYQIDNLASGTWYFAVRAYTSAGTESAASNIASKTIP